MEKKRSTTRVPPKEEDPSRTSRSIETPEVKALQATLKQAKKDQLEQSQETLAFTESQLLQSQVALQMSRDKQNETMNLFQQSMALSLSPNTLKLLQPRPQDLAYKAAIDHQQDHPATPEPPAQTDHVVSLLANLSQVMKDSNKSDIGPPAQI
jgi:hypothetical protein